MILEKIVEINNKHLRVVLTNYGATVMAIYYKDRLLTLGYPTIDEYKKYTGYLGATIGRVPGRIKDGVIIYNDSSIELEKNDNGNLLHSGSKGYDKKTFEILDDSKEDEIVFGLEGDESTDGFPGKFSIRVKYKLSGDDLTISYDSIADCSLFNSFTNHLYFNFNTEKNKECSIYNHILTSRADKFFMIDKNLIPQYKTTVKDSPLDFSNPKSIGDALSKDNPIFEFANGIDHCISTRSIKDQPIISVENEETKMDVYSSYNYYQLYTGNFMSKESVNFPFRSGFCIEPQRLPFPFIYSSYKKGNSSVPKKDKRFIKFNFTDKLL